mgnify:CR=1 FL=1
MINRLEAFDEHHLGEGDVTEGDRAFLEVTICHLTVDELVDQGADALLRVFLERAGGCLDRVCHHEDGLLTSERVRTRILEERLVDLLVGMRIAIMYVEVLGDARAVVRGDEVLDDAWQVHLLGYLETFRHMADDDLRTLQVGELVVGVDASLVLGEEHGVGHLADVVIQGSRTHQETVGVDAVGYLCGKVSHRDGVLEGAWGYLAQIAQDALVGVRQLEERHVGDEAEEFFYQVHQWVGQQEEDAVDGEVGIHVRVDVEHLRVLHQLQGEVDHATCHAHQQGGDEYL